MGGLESNLRFFAIDAAGSPLATFTVSGASAVDWEDIARGPCPAGTCVPTTCQQASAQCGYFPDGLHPDARGHRVIADLLVRRLTGILVGRPPVPEK